MASLLPRGNQPRVLIADDYEAILLVIELVLRGHATVVKASSAAEALQWAQEQEFAALLLDLHLDGGTSGLEVANEVRSCSLNRATPIVFLTGDQAAPAQVLSLPGPRCNVLFKPFKASALLAAVLPLIEPPSASSRASYGPAGFGVASPSRGVGRAPS